MSGAPYPRIPIQRQPDRRAARELPEAWVRQGQDGGEGNALPLLAIKDSSRGFYSAALERQQTAEISVASDVGNPLHEYVHHLQRAMPGLDALFHQLHRRRTAGEPRVQVGGPTDLGRKDQYVHAYAGREYTKEELPQEVLTMGVQQLFHPVWDEEYLLMLVHDDPEMLDLVLGVLFHYDPD